MKMTFDQYIANPMGEKNAVYSNRELYRNLYREKLDKILVREVGKVKYTLYRSKEDYFIHLKIPSEVVPNFYYDTVIQFYTDLPEVKASRTLSKYYIKFFSNDPSFVFTFAHAMLKNDLFIRDLVPRMSKEAVKKAAVEKNPKLEIGYVKSIYFAYLLMRSYNLFDKIQYESYAEKYNQKDLLSKIDHSDKKIQDRQTKAGEMAKSKKAKKAKEKEELRNPNISTATTINTKNTSNIKTTKVVGSTKNTKKTISTVHKTKKV